MVYRARLGLALPAMDIGKGLDVGVFFQPQASGYWGDVSGGLNDSAVGVHQAKTRLGFGPHWLDVGRFEMIYGEHLVIGNVDWHQTGRAFDGFRAHGALGDTGAYIDGFVTTLREGSLIDAVEPLFAGDFYFMGVYAGVGPALAQDLELDLYLLLNIAPKTEDVMMPQSFTATEVTLGVRSKGKVGPATLRGEAGIQVGERPGAQADVFAYQVDADAMVKVAKAVTLGLGGTYASGDDPTTADLEGWNQLYPTAHKFLGLMDIIGGRTNIAGLTGKARAGVAEDVKLGLDTHLFWRPETADGVDSFTGVETDAWVGYSIGKGMSLRSMYSFFVPSLDGPLVDDDVAHYVEIQLRYKR